MAPDLVPPDQSKQATAVGLRTKFSDSEFTRQAAKKLRYCHQLGSEGLAVATSMNSPSPRQGSRDPRPDLSGNARPKHSPPAPAHTRTICESPMTLPAVPP